KYSLTVPTIFRYQPWGPVCGASRPGLGARRGVRNRERARTTRRGGGELRSASGREGHLLPSSHGDAAVGEEPPRDRESPARAASRASARRRIYARIDFDRRTVPGDRAGLVPRCTGRPDGRELSAQRDALRLPAHVADRATRRRARARRRSEEDVTV